MSRLCVATGDGRAYYSLTTKLRAAGFTFKSLLPTDNLIDCDLVFTTAKEAKRMKSESVLAEDLPGEPGLVRGLVLSRLAKGKGTLLVGVDPGSRIGLAAFYGESMLTSRTLNDSEGLSELVSNLMAVTESARSVVRIGNGNPLLAASLAERLQGSAQGASIEIVDESGTSDTGGSRGMKRDQGAAARIAFRKGISFQSMR
jgi:hypothetical protein